MRISDWSSDVCSSDLIGDVLALPVFQVRETEGAFVIERFDPGYEFDLAMVVRMEPGDRKMTTCADDQLIGLFGIGGSPDDHRFAIGSFLPDRFNQGGAAVIAKRRIVARIAWPDRAFRRLQANGEALDGARDLIERNPAPFEEGRCRRFLGGLFSIRDRKSQ